MLTKKQSELLRFIHGRLAESGVPPSFDEMKDALDLRSKSGIHRLVVALEERGFIRRLPNRARAMEIVRLPATAVPTERRLHGFAPKLVEGPRDGGSGVIEVPIMGRIAAGTPVAALQSRTGTLALAPDMLASGEHYALEVRGDSMVGAGILDRDTVVIRRQDTAENGDVVVALIDGEEATLKRLRSRGGSVALEAANPAYETRIFGPDRVSIQGRLVSLVRRY